MKFGSRSIRWIAASLVILLSACGGGGSDSKPQGTLSVAPGSLTFVANGPADTRPAPQAIVGRVSGFSGGTLYISIVGSGSAIESISQVTFTSDTEGYSLVTVPAPASLGIGTYTGQITVKACTSDINCNSGQLTGSPQTINVTYHVAALQSSAASFHYDIGNSPAASDLVKEATITGIPVQNWTATVDVPWLTVTNSGANGSALSASLEPNALANLSNGTYTGTVTLTPGTAGQQLSIPVTLNVARTQINYVSPYVAYTGSTGEVIIRGEEFSGVTIQNVLFGATPAQSFTVVGPTEIRATLPSSLPPGRHTVRLQSSFSGVKELADLVVVDAPTFSATVLTYPDTTVHAVNAIVYDAERAALGVSVWYQSGATAFIQFPSAANVWQAPIAKPLQNNYGLALSADGKEWIAANDKAVVHINSQDLVTGETVQSTLFGSGNQIIAEMAVANDGTVAMFGDVFFNCGATLLLYDPRKHVFTAPGYTACRGSIGASGDGSRLLVPNQSLDFSTDDVFSLNTATGEMTPTGVHLLTGAQPQLDRAGARIVLQRTRVYDGAYTYLGDLPATTDAVVLSPDGSRAYGYDRSGLLFTYDLVSAPVGGFFQQIGSGITLAGNPGRAAGLYNDAEVMMAITPDDSAVFIAGKEAVIVQPTP